MSALRPGEGLASTPGIRRVRKVVDLIDQAVRLTWSASPKLLFALGAITLFQGMVPALIAWVGATIVDRVASGAGSVHVVLWLVSLEAGLVAASFVAGLLRTYSERLLQLSLSRSIETQILEKATGLALADFENTDFYNRLSLARDEAATRPLTIVQRLSDLVRDVVILLSAIAILFPFAPWALPLLILAALPGFMIEASLARRDHDHYRSRIDNRRMQAYIQVVLGREDHAKEVKLFGLGQPLIKRFVELHDRVSGETRTLAGRRFLLTSLSALIATVTLYGAYGWSVGAAAIGAISLGDMTMSMLLYRQCQSSIASALSRVGLLHADTLYLSNLTEFLSAKTQRPSAGASAAAHADGLRVEHLSFRYPGATGYALQNISFHLPAGQVMGLVGQNGSGKTTLIKLVTGLYRPTAGRILLDGLDLADWDEDALRGRFSVMFQDFTRYQFTLGENIGVGDAAALLDEDRWTAAATGAGLQDLVSSLPHGLRTQLGHWFDDGVDLSGGQWQGVAAARAWMRTSADILILDEPTSAMDAVAEAQLLARVQKLLDDKSGILISHRLATLRQADTILVLDHGAVREHGSHETLIAANGHYARLFELQASGYR